MTREELELINSSAEEKKIICTDDLKPFLRDRTLLYGYTCKGKTFHVYLKNKKNPCSNIFCGLYRSCTNTKRYVSNCH